MRTPIEMLEQADYHYKTGNDGEMGVFVIRVTPDEMEELKKVVNFQQVVKDIREGYRARIRGMLGGVEGPLSERLAYRREQIKSTKERSSE
jgi:hypothetical protein